MKTDSKNINLTSLNEFMDIHYGKSGIPKRDQLEAGYEQFKIEVQEQINNRQQSAGSNTKSPLL